ncbi:MAG: penicillin-binding protein activator [Bdellovibrionales bacterium]|nr:penicillin-binding protein activator [Bdellovibrionales bacterium]
MIWIRALLATLVIALLSCTSAPKKQAPAVAPYDAKKELSQAQIDAAAGSDKKAIARLRALITKHPKSDVADDAAVQLAKIYFKQNQFEAAYRSYMSVVDSDVFSPNEAEALLGAAKCLHKLGRLDESLALATRGLNIPGVSEAQKLDFQRHRYNLLSATGDRLEALRALAFIYAKDARPDVKSNAQARAQEIVNLGLSETDLDKVVDNEEFGFIRPQAAYRLALFRLRQKDFNGARSLFAKAAETGQGTPIQAQAQSYLAQIDSRRTVDPYTIGTVLPLTGKYAPMAQKTLRGLQLGLGIYGNDRSSFKLAVVDSEGTPEGARKGVERLVTEDNVIAVVGSLLSRTASSVAGKTEELGVPSIALSQKSGLTEAGAYIFRNAVTSEMQVKELVRIAMEQMGLKRFAMLYPNEAYGIEYANLFWDEVLARGGTITGAQPYSPSETDFRGPIKRLVGTYYLDDRKSEYQNRVREYYKKEKKLKARQSPPDDLLPPVVDFDAIFIPDSPKAVGQIAPMLAYQGVSKVRLLGTNVWNSSDFVRRGEKNVENALFVDSNMLNETSFKNSKFFKEFQRIFGEEPGIFETQGYEVGMLLRQMISGGERTRVGLAQTLAQIRQFQGVTGPMAMNSQRELVRPLTPFTVKQSAIVMWDPSLELPSETPTQKKTLRR